MAAVSSTCLSRNQTRSLDGSSDDTLNISNNKKRQLEEEEEEIHDIHKDKKIKTEDHEIKVEDLVDQPNKDILPRKKKCALLLSYCGAGYNGMQINPGVNTIEEQLINALYEAEAITLDCKINPGKMSFQRSARTDKGVSAARQIVSLKISVSIIRTAGASCFYGQNDFSLDILNSFIMKKSLIPTINKHLPEEIRVFGLIKVTKAFDCKINCSARTYEYLLPTFAFAQDYQTTKDYRITDEKIAEINEVLSVYIGTRNYHNFTSGKKFEDPSAMRYIKSFVCNKPFISNDVEFVVLTVKGQSFVLHQIRKMIGLAIAVTRGIAPRATFELAWQKPKVDIPKAPALGLALDKVHFDAYNRKFGADGIHDPLDWESAEEEIAKFKAKYIHKHMIDTEIKEHTMMRWLNTLTGHTYSNEGMEEIKNKTNEESSPQEAPESEEKS